MKKVIKMVGVIITLLLLSVSPLTSQSVPTSVSIRTSNVNIDTMQIRVTWTRLPAVPPATIAAYDVIIWSRPKIPIVEYFQVVTSDTTTYIRVPKTLIPDSTIIYAAVRSSVNPRRGAITYRKP